MLRQLLILAVAGVALWLAAQLVLPERDAPASAPIAPPHGRAPAGYLAEVSLHSAQELDTLLRRVEALLERPRGREETPLVSLVLHGPEVEFFAFKNYPRYRDVVDRAAKLAALGAVDISICQTQMRARGIADDEVPGFLRRVPYGPGEVERLLERGYVYM